MREALILATVNNRHAKRYGVINNMERLTIIIPYNVDRGYLEKALDSVNKQSVSVKLILQQGDKTCAENLADALEKVDTEFYAVLAEDDWLHEDFVKRFLTAADNQKDADIYYSDAYQMKPGGRVLWRAAYHGHADLLKKTFIHGGAVMYRTSSVREVGGYDRALTTAEEYDLHLKMSHAGMRFAYVGFPLYFYRVHGDNKSKITRSNKAERKAYIDGIRNRYR